VNRANTKKEIKTMSLINQHSQGNEPYLPSVWSRLFNSVPHMNITFHSVPDEFNPENELYLEALGILASIPAAWLIATLVVLLIYLCTRCCDTKSTKRRKSRPIRCCLSFFALVTMSALAIGFWGNHELHKGIKGLEKFTKGIDQNVRRAQELTRRYNELMMKDIQENMNNLYDGPFNSGSMMGRNQGGGNVQQAKFEIMENCDVVFYNVSSGLAAMDQLRDIIDPSLNDKPEVTFKEIPILAEAFERYRWPTTMALQGIFAIFCLLLFIGAIVHSRCILIMFSVFGLFSIIFLAYCISLPDGCSCIRRLLYQTNTVYHS